jgi:hypothetical protein
MNDCFFVISKFMKSDVLLQISKKYHNIPSTININSCEDYISFKRWSKLFNPSDIKEVNINITQPKERRNELSFDIDYFPPCVEKVNVLKLDKICPFVNISLADNDTIKFLCVDNTISDIKWLPSKITHLVLGYKFMGIVYFKSNLEIVELYGYCSGSRYSCEIDLPDTIHTIKIYSEFPARINHWSVNAKVIIEDPYSDDLEDNLEL